jgi:DNA-binding NtrC family response regulator
LGKFEEANGGTLLLDEISEMHPRLQAKLLRAIQERVIDRVGGSQPVKVNIRLLATSNRDLETEVRAGNFREDLYFRLNVVNLRLPSLRNRPGDIPALAQHFVAKFSEQNGVPTKEISPAALQLLTTHHWRGNVREMENTMHRAVLLSGGDRIEPEVIMLSGMSLTPEPAPAATPSPAMTAASAYSNARPAASTDSSQAATGLVGRTVADVERDLIIGTLSHTLGNRTHAANILGISIRTLRNKLTQYTAEGVRVPLPGEGERVAV